MLVHALNYLHAGIQNIHAMRDSLNALLKVCLASSIDMPKLLKGRHLGALPFPQRLLQGAELATNGPLSACNPP